MGGCERDEIKRLAAGMDIKNDIGLGHEITEDIIGDLLGDRAIGFAREGAVHVARINRGCPRCTAKCRIVHGRQNDHPTGYFTSGEGFCQFEQRYKAFIFVAMVAAGQKGGGAIAIADHGDRDHHGPPRGIITRIGKL